MTTATAPTRRRSGTAGRAGYLIAAAFMGVFLYLLNAEPGWRDIPFLTEETDQVLGLVNLSLVASLVANLVYMLSDAPWLKALGGLATTGIGLAALVRIWQVFPFDFAGYSFDWPLAIRIVLVVGIVGSAIGVVAQFVSLLRATAHGGDRVR
jgi:hypothetical protein